MYDEESDNDDLPPPLIKLTPEEIAKVQEDIRQSNIKKERKVQLVDKYPTITIAIIGHGADLIHEILENDDPNIRIFSRAGQPFCLGIATTKMLDFIENLYISDEREETKDTISSYQMLLEVAKHYNSNINDTRFSEMCNRLLKQNPNDSSSKHTKHIIECKSHNQIYIPYYDHKYVFTDNTSVLSGQNGIFVLETLNHTSKSNINYNNNIINLALKKYFIKYHDIQTRNIFNQGIIKGFLKKFNLEPDLETNLSPDNKKHLEILKQKYQLEQVALNKDELDEKINSFLLNSKLTRYSKKILEKFPFITIYRVVTEFVNEDSEIHELVSEDDDNIIKIKAKELNFRYIADFDVGDQLRRKELEEQRKEFMKSYTDFDGIIDGIKLSEIINFLKKEGFVVINIIDFSCRYVDEFLDDAYMEDSELVELKSRKEKKLEKIREFNEKQQIRNLLINPNIGGRKKRRTRRKKSKKRRKTRRNRKYYK